VGHRPTAWAWPLLLAIDGKQEIWKEIPPPYERDAATAMLPSKGVGIAIERGVRKVVNVGLPAIDGVLRRQYLLDNRLDVGADISTLAQLQDEVIVETMSTMTRAVETRRDDAPEPPVLLDQVRPCPVGTSR
jgi:hypothetical protein